VVVFIVAVFIVVQRYAVEWRWASVLLPSVQLLQEHMEPNAADTIPTHRATSWSRRTHSSWREHFSR
jgi:hypothetical protein